MQYPNKYEPENKPFSDWQIAIQTWHHATLQDVDRADAVLENSDGRNYKRIDEVCYSAFHIWQNSSSACISELYDTT